MNLITVSQIIRNISSGGMKSGSSSRPPLMLLLQTFSFTINGFDFVAATGYK
jgi:hypothetical protein